LPHCKEILFRKMKLPNLRKKRLLQFEVIKLNFLLSTLIYVIIYWNRFIIKDKIFTYYNFIKDYEKVKNFDIQTFRISSNSYFF
jgi:hypothetical protein